MSTPLRIPQNYENKVNRSMHDLSTIKRTTMHPGFIYPMYRRHLMAGDKIRLNISSLLQSNPLQGPLMGSYVLRAVTVFDADANRYGWLDNNSRIPTSVLLSRTKHIDEPQLSELPTTYSEYSQLEEDIKGQKVVGRGSLWDFMGICPGYGKLSDFHLIDGNPFGKKLNIDFFLTYLNAFRCFFANNQEIFFPYSKGFNSTSNDPTQIFERLNPLSTLDDLFRQLRMVDNGIDFTDLAASFPNGVPSSVSWFGTYLASCIRPHGGFLPCTYEPDIFRNLLSNSVGNVSSRVSTTDNNFTIDTLRFQNKLQRYIDRLDVSGGRFSDWLRTVWGVKTRRNLDMPDLIGVHSEFIDPSNITSVANTENLSADKGSAIGQLAGNFDNYNKKSRDISFTASEPGNVMVLVTLIPLVDYCQNIQYDLLNTSFADDYNPEFAQLGFQKVPEAKYSALAKYSANLLADGWTGGDEVNPLANVVGKQVAWLDEMTDTNRLHGEFATGGNFEYWCLQRRYLYSYLSTTKDAQGKDVPYRSDVFNLTQYINPLYFQYPFVGQGLTDPNFFLQMRFDISAIRPIGKRFMPNLE